MLDLDPDTRITAEQALAHEYLAQYADPSDEPSSEPYDESFEQKECSIEQWRSEYYIVYGLIYGLYVSVVLVIVMCLYSVMLFPYRYNIIGKNDFTQYLTYKYIVPQIPTIVLRLYSRKHSVCGFSPQSKLANTSPSLFFLSLYSLMKIIIKHQ